MACLNDRITITTLIIIITIDLGRLMSIVNIDRVSLPVIPYLPFHSLSCLFPFTSTFYPFPSPLPFPDPLHYFPFS